MNRDELFKTWIILDNLRYRFLPKLTDYEKEALRRACEMVAVRYGEEVKGGSTDGARRTGLG